MDSMRLLSCLILFLLPIVGTPTISAEPLCRMEHYSVNDGLAQGVIMGYVQDSKGYIWFASWNGLNKFDGYTFQTFKARSGDNSTLENNRIEYINTGISDWIWLRTYDLKAYIFKPETHTFIDVLDAIPPSNAKVRRLNVLPKGVVWLICDDGFCYRIDETTYQDSRSVQQYSVLQQNLKGGVVYEILQDNDRDEWILTNKGPVIIGKKTIHSQYPFQYFQEMNNRIWLAAPDGTLCRYERNGEIKVVPLPISSARISGLKAIGNKLLAIGTTHHGLFLYHTATNFFQQVDIRTKEQPSNEVRAMYVDNHGLLWMSTASEGVVHWNQSSQELFYFPPLPANHTDDKYNHTFFIFEDSNDRLWMHPKGSNLNLYDRKNNRLQYFHSDPNDPNAILRTSIHSYFPDKQGNLWMNTTNRGLEKIHFFNIPFATNNLEAEARVFFYDQEKRLWIATRDKKIRIYNEHQELIGFLNKNGQIVKQECTFSNNVYCITQIGNEIWMGTRNDGLYILKKDPKNSHRYHIQKHRNNRLEPFSLSHNEVFSIYQDSRKNIWVGCFAKGINLVRFTPEGDLEFINSNNFLKNYPQDNFLKIRCISETDNGIMLVGTTEGLVSFSSVFEHPQDIRFYTHTRRPNDKTSLSGNNVIHICNTRKQETYISTLGGGINKVIFDNASPENIRFKSYNEAVGLTFDWALSSTEDSNGNLWIVSENMISKFDPETETFDNYRWNLLKTDMFYSESPPLINTDGELLIGHNKGFISLSIHEISKSRFVPPIVLTHIKIFNEEQFIQTDGLTEISLKPEQRNITIEFAALDYADPDNISYAYKLNKLDADWNYIGKERSVSYVNFPPGKHRLLIRSTNSDGVWVDNEYTLTIHALPRFVETGWFLLLSIFLLVMFIVIAVYILFYIYRLRHKVDVEQQITDIKLRFFTNISHELRTPLTLIVGPVSEMQNEALPPKSKEYLRLIQKNTDRMLRLVNQILDFRKIQNKKMKLLIEEVDIVGLIPDLIDHFRLAAAERNIRLQFVSDSESLFLWLDVDKIEKIIFNILSNAFKYTPNGKSISIKIESDKSSVRISIADEGKGICPQKIDTIFQRFETIINRDLLEPSSGIGLSLTRELVELHHGSINATSRLGTGSIFCVTLPKGKKHFMGNELVEFILSDSPTNSKIPAENQIPSGAPSDNTVEEEEKEEEENKEKTTILLVEDNEVLRLFLRDILIQKYRIVEAVDGKDGLQKAQEQLPDMIVSDIMMPVMDGLDMVKAIKENNDICHIPIVLLSAKSSLDDRIMGLEYGIDDYITKPFSATHLKVRIASIINTRKQLQESYRNTLLEPERCKIDITPAEPQMVPSDKLFIDQLIALMEENMSNSELIVDDLGKAFGMGRTLFYNKVKSILGVSPIEFIGKIRIKRAAQLIDHGERNIAQVAYATGFNDPKYFSRCFKKHMNMTPVQYREQKDSR